MATFLCTSCENCGEVVVEQPCNSIGTKRKRENSLDAVVYDTLMRLYPNESVRKDSITDARLVKFMIEEEQLVQDPAFDAELAEISNSGDFWVEKVDNPAHKFPPARSSEKSSVQPFFNNVMTKFTKLCSGKKLVFRAGPDGKYNVATKLGNVTCMPDASVHETSTIGSRRPDVNIYYQTAETKGVLRIVSSWELRPRGAENDHCFGSDEIGQLIETNLELMRQQPFRMTTLAVLSDGVRFVFFKIIRSIRHRDEFKVIQSNTFLNMRGWAVTSWPILLCAMLTYLSIPLL